MNKLVISNIEFKGMLINIARQMAKDHWRPDYIVGLTRGGLQAAVMLSHYLDVPMHTLNVSLRDSDTGPESNLWMAEDAFGYNKPPKNILIVDDINDSGATLNWIMRDWPSGCFPDGTRWSEMWGTNVRFAVLVDNLASNCVREVDYCGLEINKAEEDVWVEFPYEEWWTK
jgi:hypoxanthine-guanine phosphoribosyltransferase